MNQTQGKTAILIIPSNRSVAQIVESEYSRTQPPAKRRTRVYFPDTGLVLYFPTVECTFDQSDPSYVMISCPRDFAEEHVPVQYICADEV